MMNLCSNAGRAKAIWVKLSCAVWFACLLFSCRAVHADTWAEVSNHWIFTFPVDTAINQPLSTPAVAPDGTIYAGSFDGTLYAFSPDGKVLWHFEVGREIKSSPAIADDGTIYFGDRDHWLYAVTPGGKLKWKFLTDGWVDSSPAIAADGTIYFGSWDKNFYALNPDGSLKWKFAVDGIVDSSPAIAADGTVYFGSHNTNFYALDAAGKPRWTFPTQAQITTSPAIGADGSIYFGSTDGFLYHLKPDGTEIWRCRTDSGADGSPVLADNGNIVIAAAYKTLIISPAGQIIWHGDSPGWIDQTPAAGQGMVCFVDFWHQLVATQPDGSGLWFANLGYDVPTSSPVIGDNGQVYFTCGIHFWALQPPSPILPANSSWPMFRANARHTGRVGTIK